MGIEKLFGPHGLGKVERKERGLGFRRISTDKYVITMSNRSNDQFVHVLDRGAKVSIRFEPEGVSKYAPFSPAISVVGDQEGKGIKIERSNASRPLEFEVELARKLVMEAGIRAKIRAGFMKKALEFLDGSKCKWEENRA